MGMEGDFSIDKRRANSKGSLEIIKCSVQGVRSKSAAAALQMTIIHDFEK